MRHEDARVISQANLQKRGCRLLRPKHNKIGFSCQVNRLGYHSIRHETLTERRLVRMQLCHDGMEPLTRRLGLGGILVGQH